jgi:hypothetical protein
MARANIPAAIIANRRGHFAEDFKDGFIEFRHSLPKKMVLHPDEIAGPAQIYRRFRNNLAFTSASRHRFYMGMPENPVTFTPEQIVALNKKLSQMRHDINNHLSLIIAAAELMKFKPELKERVLNTLTDQSPKIVNDIQKFSSEFEQAFGISRDY